MLPKYKKRADIESAPTVYIFCTKTLGKNFATRVCISRNVIDMSFVFRVVEGADPYQFLQAPL